MAAQQISDLELIRGLKSEGEARNLAWHYIYLNWIPDVYNRVLKKGAASEEAQAAFLDCFVSFEKRVIQDDFRVDKSLQAYLATCIYNEWCRQQSRKTSVKPDHVLFDDASMDFEDSADDRIPAAEVNQIIDTIIEEATSEKCRKIIRDFYAGIKQKTIAEELKSTTDSIKTLKTHCFKRLKDWLEQYPDKAFLLKKFLSHG